MSDRMEENQRMIHLHVEHGLYRLNGLFSVFLLFQLSTTNKYIPRSEISLYIWMACTS